MVSTESSFFSIDATVLEMWRNVYETNSADERWQKGERIRAMPETLVNQ